MKSWDRDVHDPELTRLFRLGWTYPRISMAMGFGLTTLRKNSARIGLGLRQPRELYRFSPDVIAALTLAASDPTLKSWDEVGAAAGMTASQAEFAARRRGIPRIRRVGGNQKKQWSEETMDRRLIELVNSGVRPIRRIATELGVTKNTVSGRLWRLQIFLKEKEKPPHPMMSVPTNGCLWPNVDRETVATEFCGKPHAGPGLPYCPTHMERAYMTADQRNRRRRHDRR